MLTTPQLAPSERLITYRRRTGLTQTQASQEWGFTEWHYRMLEAGNRQSFCQRVWIGKLKPHESAFLMRRRYGYKRTDLAKMIGVSCWWLTQMERGRVNPKRLIEFWS